MAIEVSFEGIEARGDSLSGWKFGGDGVGGLQAVAGEADGGDFLGVESFLRNQFLRDARSDAAGAFREKASGIFVMSDPPAMGTTTLSGSLQPSCSAISYP